MSTATATLRERRDTQRASAAFGMWIFIAGEAMFFGGLLFAYAYGRLHYPDGFAAAGRATDVVLGTVNTALLLTSSFLVALAAASRTPPRHVAPLLAGTALLGVVFMVIKGFEYHGDWTHGFFPGPGFQLGDGSTAPPGAELFCMLYLTMTGVHALHLLVGIGWMGLAAWSARLRPRQWARSPRLEVAGLYWHFVDVVWIFLYPLLYLVLRHR